MAGDRSKPNVLEGGIDKTTNIWVGIGKGRHVWNGEGSLGDRDEKWAGAADTLCQQLMAGSTDGAITQCQPTDMRATRGIEREMVRRTLHRVIRI